ncbi:hypothetical protein ACFC06_03095 [Nocardia sp. NPDC056064]|uniref:hypothetical protein n=1 Tax=Nocardia sp. NPDC056064 TaxID=3345701 RepID=UPI0035D905BD
MRWILSVLILCATCFSATSVAAADPFDGPPVETVRLVHDFGRCDTDLLVFSSDVPVQLDLTVRNQFDPEARMRIPLFLWSHDLPMTIDPVTHSVKFMARAGEYTFDIVTGPDDHALCEGMLIAL